MFVKKFEASSLEAAIAAIKNEFGPGALILSTQQRKGNLFQKPSVEVTAAFTESSPEVEAPLAPRAIRSSGISYRSTGASAGSVPVRQTSAVVSESQRNKPLYINIDAPEDHRDPSPRKSRGGFQTLESMWLESGFRPETAKEMTARMLVDFSQEDLREKEFLERVKVKMVSESVRTLFPETFDNQKRWLIVGGPGSGKTTTAVKLALFLKRSGREVGLASWEDRKVTGAREIEGYAKLIKVPFFKPGAAMTSGKIILFDTSAWDPKHLAQESWTSEKFDGVLLVVDARERFSESQHLARRISEKTNFSAVAFSRLDLIQSRGFLFDMLRSSRTPLLGGSLSASFKTPFKFFEPSEFSQYVTASTSHRGES